MAVTAAKSLSRLAQHASVLVQRRSTLTRLRIAAESVQKSGSVVAGELWLLDRLTAKLDEAIAVLESMPSVQNMQEASELLQRLDAALLDAEWDAADEVLAELNQRDKEQQKQIQEIGDRVADWQSRLRDLLASLEAGRRARAPIRREEKEALRLQGWRAQVERALRDGQVSILVDFAEELTQVSEIPGKLEQQVADKTEETRWFTRQGDLLMLQSPLVEDRFEYTVLLRTPSEPGTHSINIQDSSTISQQDRWQMADTIDKVTAAVNAGLARRYETRGRATPATEANGGGELIAGEAVSPEPASAEPVAPAADATRHLFAVDARGDPQTPTDIATMAEDVGDLMYRLFMPEPMQQYVSANPCSLTITTNDLELPWELMWYQGKFLCLERPVARLPMGKAFPRTQPRFARAGRKLQFLLVHADPQGTLPAARQEVDRIRDGLQETWKDEIDIDTLYSEQAQGRVINEYLRRGQYDVIHYAGHAAFNEANPDLSGLLLHDNEVFFAQKIRRLLEGRPLVFLNACESGRTANEASLQHVDAYFQKPAEGLASAFIYGGALGCIGALWPVYDQPAAEFAVQFYNHVLEGHMIGEAMRRARVQSREQFPNQITWAAFALYGDPTFRLVE